MFIRRPLFWFRLRLYGVQSGRDDEGMYQCGATNNYGTVFSTGELRVLCMQLFLKNILMFDNENIIYTQQCKWFNLQGSRAFSTHAKSNALQSDSAI